MFIETCMLVDGVLVVWCQCLVKLTMSDYFSNLLAGMRGATIRLPDCPGQSIFGLGNYDLQKSCLIGQVQIISKFTQISSHSMLKTSKVILISYKPSKYSNFLTKYMFCFLGKFGQAVLWPRLPDQVTKKKENSRSLLGWVDSCWLYERDNNVNRVLTSSLKEKFHY